MTFTPVIEIEIKLGVDDTVCSTVGRLAIRDRRIYFQYDADFIKQGVELSPFSLPLKAGLQSFDRTLFEGLPGLFNDSLPDGWGRLLLDRAMREQGIVPAELSALDRLAFVGNNGMGALVYEPGHGDGPGPTSAVNLDLLAEQTRQVLSGAAGDVLQTLIALNGSSAGARPKALIGVDSTHENVCHDCYPLPTDYEHWLVKFPNTQDGIDAGAIEYVYALMAHDAGVNMMDVHLYPAKEGPGYFATKRFDRDGDRRRHTHTACGLLHSDFRTPALDYKDLLALASQLTRDVREVEKMYRLAVFNVLAHNRDDHSKNFSFLMARDREWTLSPAYDLTFSSGPGGEQSTLVAGHGKKPTVAHVTELGLAAGIAKQSVSEIIERTRSALSGWRSTANTYGVSTENIDFIAATMRSIG